MGHSSEFAPIKIAIHPRNSQEFKRYWNARGYGEYNTCFLKWVGGFARDFIARGAMGENMPDSRSIRESHFKI